MCVEDWTYLGTFGIFQVLVMMIVIVENVWCQRYVTISHLAGKRLLSLQLHLLVVGTKIRSWKKKSIFNQYIVPQDVIN